MLATGHSDQGGAAGECFQDAPTVLIARRDLTHAMSNHLGIDCELCSCRSNRQVWCGSEARLVLATAACCTRRVFGLVHSAHGCAVALRVRQEPFWEIGLLEPPPSGCLWAATTLW